MAPPLRLMGLMWAVATKLGATAENAGADEAARATYLEEGDAEWRSDFLEGDGLRLLQQHCEGIMS